MEKETINKLLDTTFELEGLLTLASSREENISHIENLIRVKIQTLQKLAGEKEEVEGKQETFEPAAIEEPSFYGDSEETAEAAIFEEEEEARPDMKTKAEPFAAKEPKEREVKLKAQFSVNDKFRFIRELFGNSPHAFEGALAFIDTLDSIDEAEDYVYGDLNLDQENPVVQEFMGIVEKHFE